MARVFAQCLSLGLILAGGCFSARDDATSGLGANHGSDASVSIPDAGTPDVGTITEGPDATVATSADAAAVDNEWALWPVPPAHPSDYSATADVVTDNVTGLIWQQVVPNGTFTWERAKSYCEGLELGGYS